MSPALAKAHKAKAHAGRGEHHGPHGATKASHHGARARHGRHAHEAPIAGLPPEQLKTASADIPTANLDTLSRLDPEGKIRKPLLAAALVALERHHSRIGDTSHIFVADFSKHSSDARLFMVDVTSGNVTAFRTAHGRGSDPDRTGWAKRFSNAPGSYASSVGAYVTTGQSFGLRHGPHIGLEGLDSTNSLAKDRAIVVHSAEYCETSFLRAFGMLGRSEGCFATSSKDLALLLPRMAQGRLLYAGV